MPVWSVMRRMVWSSMDEPERAALCARGLDAIFDPHLRAAIGRIIDDVREHGDDAVCRALREFDRVSLEPHQLRATTEEIESARVAPEVDAAIDDAIAHLRAFNEQLMARAVRRSGRTSTGTWYVAPPTRRLLTSTTGLRFVSACLKTVTPVCDVRASTRSIAP